MLAEEGVEVTIPGRNIRKVNEAIATLSGNVHGIETDLGTAEGAKKLIAQIPETDILVNNLGIYESKDFTDTTDKDWLHYLRSISWAGFAWLGTTSPPCSSATRVASSSSPVKPPQKFIPT